jgi:dynein heavy chain
VPQLFKTVVHKQVLRIVDSSDDWVTERRVQMEKMLESALPPVVEYLKLFDTYEELLQLDPSKYVAEKVANDISTEDTKECILENTRMEKVVSQAIPDTIVVGLFEVSCAEIRKQLSGKYKAIADLLLDMLIHRFRDGAQAISDQFQGYFAQLRKAPKDIEGVTDMREYMSQMPGEILKVQPDMKKCADVYQTLEWFGVKMTNDDSYMHWRVYKSPKQAHDMMESTEVGLQKCEKQFMQAQADEQTEFDESLLDLAGIIEGFAQYNDLAKVKEIFENVESVNDRLKQAQEKSKLFNSRETLFGKDTTDYSQLQQLQKEWEPFSQLWLTAYHWIDDSKKWMSGPFEEIDAKHCENSVSNGTKTLFKAVKSFEKRDDAQKVLQIARLIKGQIDDFAPNVPIVVGLRNPGMRERHWAQVSDRIAQVVTPEMENFTLEEFLSLGMVTFGKEIEDIGERSGKELAIDNQLKNMKKQWEGVLFDCNEPYRSTETYILKGADEVMAILDEQIVVTQAMQFSPFNKPFKADIDEWNEKLAYVSECLDQWLKVQRAWMYLQPIFDSADIMKQLPAEGKKIQAR